MRATSTFCLQSYNYGIRTTLGNLDEQDSKYTGYTTGSRQQAQEHLQIIIQLVIQLIISHVN